MERAELTEALRPLITTLTDLDGTVRQVAEEQADREHRQARRTRWIGAGIALLVAVAMALGYVALTNRTVLDKINAVTGPAAVDRQAVGTAGLLAGNQRESDCLSRRQQARLPAPPAAPAPPPGIKARDLGRFLAPYSCVGQTPPDVYPGLVGEPPRN